MDNLVTFEVWSFALHCLRCMCRLWAESSMTWPIFILAFLRCATGTFLAPTAVPFSRLVSMRSNYSPLRPWHHAVVFGIHYKPSASQRARCCPGDSILLARYSA